MDRSLEPPKVFWAEEFAPGQCLGGERGCPPFPPPLPYPRLRQARLFCQSSPSMPIQEHQGTIWWVLHMPWPPHAVFPGLSGSLVQLGFPTWDSKRKSRSHSLLLNHMTRPDQSMSPAAAFLPTGRLGSTYFICELIAVLSPPPRLIPAARRGWVPRAAGSCRARATLTPCQGDTGSRCPGSSCYRWETSPERARRGGTGTQLAGAPGCRAPARCS